MSDSEGRCPVHPSAAHVPMKNIDDRFWGHDGAFEYARCTECGTLALDPQPEPVALGPYYADYYPPQRLKRLAKAIANNRLGFLRRRKLRAYYSATDKYIPQELPELDVLDVGCGLGHFLGGVKSAGARSARGVDFGEECARFVRETYGVEVDEGELEDQNYEEGRFSLVTPWHFLEHVFDPAKTLKEFHRVTAEGGYCFVEVPVRTPIAHLFGKFWMPLQAPTHLWHFTPDTLKTLFEDAGYEVLSVQRAFQPAEVATSSVLLITKGLMPKVIRRPFTLRFLYVALMALFELPVTIPMTLLGKGGLLRVVARRPSS